MSAFGRLRQEDYLEFKASLGQIVRPVSKQNKIIKLSQTLLKFYLNHVTSASIFPTSEMKVIWGLGWVPSVVRHLQVTALG